MRKVLPMASQGKPVKKSPNRCHKLVGKLPDDTLGTEAIGRGQGGFFRR